MLNLVFFDSDVRPHLLPLTYSRPVGDLRCGILTIREKWEHHLGVSGSFLTDDSLRELYPVEQGEHNLLINGAVLPTPALAEQVRQLVPGEAFQQNGLLVATCLNGDALEALIEGDEFDNIEAFELEGEPVRHLTRPADIFTFNGEEIRRDFALLIEGRTSATPSTSNTFIGDQSNLFLEEGVTMEACTLNLTTGPVYIGHDAVVLEGCLLRGPISVGEGAALKMGAKVYSNTTIGPKCKVGGEVNNVVFHSNSNKGHDGFLGNAVIGQWCNIGADTNASNLKNDYGEVRVWDYVSERFAKTGLQFHGLVMGDHSKLAINCMMNTGTVVGFSANVFGEGFPRTFIPSFSWGGAGGFRTYRLDKALATAERVMARRERQLSDEDRDLFARVFDASEKYRPE
ncbi:GlmU family protein [Lewinella sp. 4G2]|uniref:GlmU family protein n=1 Tax=Lewinella sp. 4G2 TaxID=1803372 RepID=UPI0007B48592|nr:GlmU family protein [Lewinella sp. 4G2]OAV45633.1 glucose-1-phosphate thymidylyltransferase [Lewinella sp. 4G2]